MLRSRNGDFTLNSFFLKKTSKWGARKPLLKLPGRFGNDPVWRSKKGLPNAFRRLFSMKKEGSAETQKHVFKTFFLKSDLDILFCPASKIFTFFYFLKSWASWCRLRAVFKTAFHLALFYFQIWKFLELKKSGTNLPSRGRRGRQLNAWLPLAEALEPITTFFFLFFCSPQWTRVYSLF